MKHVNLKKSYISKDCIKSNYMKNYIYAKNYNEYMINKVEPYLNSIRKSGYITGINNMKLYYEEFIIDNSLGNIVICHGIGEYSEKYNELIYYFLESRYSVFIIEHRGNGRSGRLGKDSGQVSIEKFDYYVDDFKTFIDNIVIPHGDGKSLILFAHSMGGGIGTVFLEKYPEYFQSAVLSSPMHKISTGKSPVIEAEILARILVLVGKGNAYMPGQKPYSGKRRFPNRTTSCSERYDYQYNKILSNNNFQTGGASAKWYLEASKATSFIRNKKNSSKVKIPVMLLQAEYDTHVIPNAHYKFAQFAENCEVVIVNGSKHESFFEIDEITSLVIDKILRFINEK